MLPRSDCCKEKSEQDYLIVNDKEKKYSIDLDKRLLKFAVNSIKFIQTLPYKKEYEVFRYQLSKSSTSIGANFQEAQSATYKEFVAKLRIALREANETNYWMKIILELKIGDFDKLNELNSEVTEIAKILGAIVSKASRKLSTGEMP